MTSRSSSTPCSWTSTRRCTSVRCSLTVHELFTNSCSFVFVYCSFVEAMEDSDEEEEDDTAERMEVCGEASETPPKGFVYAPCPPLATEAEQRALCGRSILAAHILDGATGWYVGKVQNLASALRGSSQTRRTSYCTRRRRRGSRSSTGAWHASSRPTTTGLRSGGCSLTRSPRQAREVCVRAALSVCARAAREGVLSGPPRLKISRLRRALISYAPQTCPPRFLISPKESGPKSPANF